MDNRKEIILVIILGVALLPLGILVMIFVGVPSGLLHQIVFQLEGAMVLSGIALIFFGSIGLIIYDWRERLTKQIRTTKQTRVKKPLIEQNPFFQVIKERA